MLPIVILSVLAVIFNAVTTIPFSIGLLTVSAVVFRKPSVFFLALGLGMIIDLFLLRPLGQTGLVFTIFLFVIWLYEKKFETQTFTFVFAATFLGSLIYLIFFGYNNVLFQSLANAIISIFLFKFLISNFKFKMKS